ncbi:flagellar protein FlgN [Cohnella faecalis]|uniref:Flagellar protein FlgN n=1 Tax=Cohnella faecalis TaxID=2315694 RepID=A0A398CMP0_9BACL|nr:flagellar protein FlgN [Cohnella faecalis]RIE02058.1 flagellar protein FlgN [Cohnella faecalis]
MIRELIDILDTLQLQHEQLIDLAEAKKEAVMGNQLDKLTEVTSRESRLVKQIGETEQRRVLATASILRKMGLKATARTTLSDLIVYVTTASDKEKLTEAARKLSARVQTLKRLNDQNMALIQQAKDFNDFSLDLLTGGNEPDYIYAKPSVPGNRPKPNLFDSRA